MKKGNIETQQPAVDSAFERSLGLAGFILLAPFLGLLIWGIFICSIPVFVFLFGGLYPGLLGHSLLAKPIGSMARKYGISPEAAEKAELLIGISLGILGAITYFGSTFLR